MSDDETFNNTSAFSLNDTDVEWVPDEEGTASIEDLMAVGRSNIKQSISADYEELISDSSSSSLVSKPAVASPFPSTSKPKKASWIDDDDAETLLTFRRSDLLGLSTMDDNDADDINVANIMHSVVLDNVVSLPPGLQPVGVASGANAPSSMFMNQHSRGLQHGAYHQAGLNGQAHMNEGHFSPPNVGGPVGSMQHHPQHTIASNAPASSHQQPQAIPEPPKFSPEQLASLSSQERSQIEQWNILYQQQAVRRNQEEAAQQKHMIAMMQRNQSLLKQEQQAIQQQQAQQAIQESTQQAPEAAAPSKANRKGLWAGAGTERMSPYEIDTIIKFQEMLVASENPFLDDYYHQNIRILTNPANYAAHRPICNVAPPKQRAIDPTKKDPFAGCLGRLASGSSRAPRLMALLSETPQKPKPVEQKTNGDNNGKSSKNDNKKSQNQNPETTPDSTTSAEAKVGSSTLTLSRPEPEYPFKPKLGTISMPGGIKVTQERRLMLLIEDAYVVLLELEDLKQMHLLHIHAAKDPQFNKHSELEAFDSMILEHLSEIVSLLKIPKAGSPESQFNHPNYASWESFMLSILAIQKGSRLVARLLSLLPATASITLLKLFVRNTTWAAQRSIQEDQNGLVSIADYLRRVILQCEVDLLYQLLITLDQDTQLMANLFNVLCTRVGSYLISAIFKRANQLKVNIMFTKDPLWRNSFLPAYLNLHGRVLASLRTRMSSYIAYCTAHAAYVKQPANVDPFTIVVAPPKLSQTPVKTSENSSSNSSDNTQQDPTTAQSTSSVSRPLYPVVNKIVKSSHNTSVPQSWELLFYLTLSSSAQEKKFIYEELSQDLSADVAADSPNRYELLGLKATFLGVLAQQSDAGFHTNQGMEGTMPNNNNNNNNMMNNNNYQLHPHQVPPHLRQPPHSPMHMQGHPGQTHSPLPPQHNSPVPQHGSPMPNMMQPHPQQQLGNSMRMTPQRSPMMNPGQNTFVQAPMPILFPPLGQPAGIQQPAPAQPQQRQTPTNSLGPGADILFGD